MSEAERIALAELAVKVTQASSGGVTGGEMTIAARTALQEARVGGALWVPSEKPEPHSVFKKTL